MLSVKRATTAAKASAVKRFSRTHDRNALIVALHRRLTGQTLPLSQEQVALRFLMGHGLPVNPPPADSGSVFTLLASALGLSRIRVYQVVMYESSSFNREALEITEDATARRKARQKQHDSVSLSFDLFK